MNPIEKDFCCCTIALGRRYRVMAKELAADLEKYAPGTPFVIFTDRPADFKEHANAIAYKHRQQGIQRCSNDRRLLIEKALSVFPSAIHIDADTRLLDRFPDRMEFSPGITGTHQNLIEHLQKYRPQNLEIIKTVASKLDIPLEGATWVGESLYIITRDGGKEKEFFRLWGNIARYVELKGMYGGDGNLMGLAAAKVGWTAHSSETWNALKDMTKHLDASHQKSSSSWENFQRRLAYHYRLNWTRLVALKDFNFYYR